MIKWPRKKKIRVGIITEPWESGFNFAIDLCIEAEKKGRISLDEIYTIIAAKPVTSFSPDRMSRRMMEQAKAIHAALYGGTKPDERKEEKQ